MLKQAPILLGGPDVLVLDALKALLEKNFSSVEVAHDLSEFLDLLRTGIFLVAVYDTNWADWFEHKIRKMIRESDASIASIALVSATHFGQSPSLTAARSYWITKSQPATALVDTISSALGVLSADQFQAKLGLKVRQEENLTSSALQNLTRRQRQIMDLVATGEPLKWIAGNLNISVRTVEFHKYKLMKLLGVSTTAELVRVALLSQSSIENAEKSKVTVSSSAH